ncbi:MAG: DUF2254 domain-containing protein [Pseudomonadota bacterium]
MKTQLLKYWDHIRSSFWFLPSIMAAGAVVLSFATVALDKTVATKGIKAFDWVYTGGAEGASAVLQTIAGSMITIAGVVFSLTLVALSLASSQFGPRLLRNFMRDTTNQLVLGTFVATFLYCLLVLRTIRRADAVAFVPHLSVTLGVLFALASLWVLIYFIHHVSVSIQADEIVARVGSELNDVIERLYPVPIVLPLRPINENNSSNLPDALGRDGRAVGAPHDGYLQIIDTDALAELAEEEKILLRVERRPGHYIVKGSPLITVWPGDRVCDDLSARMTSAFVVGNQRTPSQDIEFPVYQLVEIAVRALSPGVNDPFTAVVCLDRLSSALSRLAQREMPSGERRDADNRLLLIVPSQNFPDIVDAAFNQIRQDARSNAAVTIRLLETITVIAQVARRLDDQAALLRHADMIARGARQGLPEENDRQAVEECYARVSRLLREAAQCG